MFSYLFSSPVCNLSPIVTPSSRWYFPHRKWVLTSHIGFAFCMNTLHFLQAWPFPCEAADTLFPAWFWLLIAGHSPCGSPATCFAPAVPWGLLFPQVFLCPAQTETSCWITPPWGALSTWLGFHPLRPGYHSVDALFILFIVALAHLPCSFPTEILSTPCTGCEFSMPGRLFGGIPSLPLWAKPPFWATLLHGWPSCPHTLFGALSIPSWGSLSDLSSGLISWLPFPALSTSHRCAQALISYTRPSSPAVCTLCSVFLFSFLSYFISYTL